MTIPSDRFKYFSKLERITIYDAFISEQLYLTGELRKGPRKLKLSKLLSLKKITDSLAAEIDIT